MDDDCENVKKKTEECQKALFNELHTYAVSRLMLSTPGCSLKIFHRTKMRNIINNYFNSEESDWPNLQLWFPNQTVPLTLVQYGRKLFKKTNKCKAALLDELDTYLQVFIRGSATGRSVQYFANLKTFHREQMLFFIEEYFDTEEDNQPILPSTAPLRSVNQLDVTSNQEAMSVQVVTTPSSLPISVTPGDQQQLANSGVVQVMEKPIEEDNSTGPGEGSSSIIEKTVNVSATGQHQSDSEAISVDCLANQRPVQAEGDSAVNSPESDNYTAPVGVAPQNDANVSIKSEIDSECECEFKPEDGKEDDKEKLAAWLFNKIYKKKPEIDEANNSHNRENSQFGEMQTDAQQQATESIAVNTNYEQVDNSNNNHSENFDDFQASYFIDCETVEEQSLAEYNAANDNLPLDFNPNVGLDSLPSTLTGRRSSRPKRKIDYEEINDESFDSFAETSTVKRRNKRPKRQARKLTVPKRVNIEPVIALVAEEEEEHDEVQFPLTVIVQYLKCPKSGCKKKCKDEAKLKGHLWKKHQIKEFQCKVKDCTLSFASQDELENHQKSAHGKLKNLPCAMCNKTLKSYKKLYIHFWNNHEKGRFQCSEDKCDFTGKTRKSVRRHQRQHLPRKFDCTFAGCAWSFIKKSHLTDHLRLHSQEIDQVDEMQTDTQQTTQDFFGESSVCSTY